MEKFFAFIFLLFPQLILAQADGAGTELRIYPIIAYMT